MRTNWTIFTLIPIIVTSSSCMNLYKSAQRDRNKFDRTIAELEKRNDIILIRSIFDIKSDTLNVKLDQFASNEIHIIIRGTNTFNFLHLYDISTGRKIGLDSTACVAGEFLSLKIRKGNRRQYLLSNWGCHYGRTIHLNLE
jgi:hypothetical protein